MRINLKCFSKLVNPESCNFTESTAYELEAGQTVEDLLKQAQIPSADVKITFVNSRIVGLDSALSDGDNVGLAPAVGGM